MLKKMLWLEKLFKSKSSKEGTKLVAESQIAKLLKGLMYLINELDQLYEKILNQDDVFEWAVALDH